MPLTKEQVDVALKELHKEICTGSDMIDPDFHAWVAKAMSILSASIGLNHPFCSNIIALYENYTGDQRNILAVFQAACEHWKKGYLPLVTELNEQETKQRLGAYVETSKPFKRRGSKRNMVTDR